MEPLYRQLIGFTQEPSTRPRWIIAPSLAVGHTLAERLALDGYGWTNLRFTTAVDLAVRVAGPALASAGVAVMDGGVGPALILQSLLDLGEEVPKYFRAIAEQPGVAEALWRAVNELRMAGLAATDLRPAAFTSTAQCGELSALLTAFEEHLRDSHVADTAGVLRAAGGCRNPFPVTAACQILEMPGACPSELERCFVDSLPGERVAARVLELPGKSMPDAGLSARPQEAAPPTIVVESNSQRLAWIAAPTTAPAPLGDDSLSLFRAAGREAEVAEVLRRIQRSELPLDTVEIICGQQGEYATLLWEKSQRLEIPVTMETGIPGTLTRPLRAALGLCDWMERDFPAARLARILEAGILDCGDAEHLSAAAAARTLRRAGATVGRTTYATALSALAATSEAQARDAELDDEVREFSAERARHAHALRVWVASLLEAIPQPGGDELVRLGDVLAAIVSFLQERTSVGNEEDAGARAAGIAALKQLEPLSEWRRRMAFQLALVRAQLQGITVGAERPRPGKLHISALSGASFSGRRATFVLGLEEGSVFPYGMEDPVLLDAERLVLAPGRLTVSAESIDRFVYDTLTRLASLDGSVTLSYSCRDLRAGRQTYPSWLVFHAWQLLDPTAKLRHDDLAAFLGDLVTVVAGDCADSLSDAEWWLSGSRGAGQAARPALSALRPAIDRSYRAEDGRKPRLHWMGRTRARSGRRPRPPPSGPRAIGQQLAAVCEVSVPLFSREGTGSRPSARRRARPRRMAGSADAGQAPPRYLLRLPAPVARRNSTPRGGRLGTSPGARPGENREGPQRCAASVRIGLRRRSGADRA